MTADSLRPYRGPLRGVILDWAGTTVDYGSRAPAGVFVEVFRRASVPITLEQARGPMGVHKRDHIAQLLQLPEVDAAWRKKHGRAPNDSDIDALYAGVVPRQLEILPDYCELIPGTLEAAAAFRERGMKIGTTTGYNRAMMDVVAREAQHRGYEPDCVVSADDVPAARPHPWMALRAAIELQVWPMEAFVKVGDTVPDILEGLNAGMWTVAVTKTGNELGLSEDEVAVLDKDDLERRLAAACAKLRAAGAHYVVEGVGDIPALLDEIESRLRGGERP